MAEKIICHNCGYVGEPQRITKGSFAIELGLWIVFLLPGLIYSIWRLTSRYDGCSKCESKDIVSVYSPIGQKLLKELYH